MQCLEKSVYKSDTIYALSKLASHGSAPVAATVMLSEVNNSDLRPDINVRPINLAALLRRPDDDHFGVEKLRYKWKHDNKGHFEPTYVSADYVFVDRPPKTAFGA